MNDKMELLGALLALLPASMLFLGSLILFVRRKTGCPALQVIGAGCLTVVVLTHVAEALHLFPRMGWGLSDSAGHYLNLVGAILGLLLFPVGYFGQLLSPTSRTETLSPCGMVELTSDLARRRSLLVAALAVLLLAGCFPAVPSFSKPGVSEEEYERDRYVCMRESRARIVVGGEEATTLHGERQREANRLFEACMTARGYRRSE